MNILELEKLKLILEERLKRKKDWVDSERGHNYEEYRKREVIYHYDENHEKLKKINRQIEQLINSI